MRWNRPFQLLGTQDRFLPIGPANEIQVVGLLLEDESLATPLGLRPARKGVGLAYLKTGA